MRNYLLSAALALAGSQLALAQTAPAPRYMHIFYEGAGWRAARYYTTAQPCAAKPAKR